MPMFRLLPCLMLLVGSLSMAGAVKAADIPQEPVRFAAGTNSTSISGTISGDNIIDYVLNARAGETLIVSMTTDNLSNYFNVLAPGQNDVAFFTGAFEGNSYVGQLTESGDYKVRVYLERDAVKRGDAANYTLSLQLASGDYADGLQGGPDFWQISGVGAGKQLALHDGPSKSNEVVLQVADGTVLRNLGCTVQGGTRWCRVRTLGGQGINGWAPGQNLIESSQTDAGSQVSETATRTQRVRFPSGSSTTMLNGSLSGGEAINYIVDARDGQFLSVSLSSQEPTTRFNIFLPGGTLIYQSADSASGNSYKGQLYINGEYTITAYSTGPQGQNSEFQLDIAVE